MAKEQRPVVGAQQQSNGQVTEPLQALTGGVRDAFRVTPQMSSAILTACLAGLPTWFLVEALAKLSDMFVSEGTVAALFLLWGWVGYATKVSSIASGRDRTRWLNPLVTVLWLASLAAVTLVLFSEW